MSIFSCRIFPNGEVQYLHPKDGVYPEKVNAGREPVGKNDRSIGQNTNPVRVRTPMLSTPLNNKEHVKYERDCIPPFSGCNKAASNCSNGLG